MPEPADPPPDPSPHTLDRIGTILHEYQVAPEHADHLLTEAVEEVLWRHDPTPKARDARLVRSVERRARRYQRVLRQRYLELFDYECRRDEAPE